VMVTRVPQELRSERKSAGRDECSAIPNHDGRFQ
jgi:hypothetical protein